VANTIPEKASGGVITSSGANEHLKGIPEWLTTRTYRINNFIPHLGILYKSLDDINTGNIPASSPLKWEVVGGSEISIFEVSGNHTILDGDGNTDIFVTTGGSTATITLPDVGNNEFRVLRIYKADTGSAKVNITRAGSDTWENGLDATSLIVPLMSAGDHIEIIASNSTRTKWDIRSAYSNWRKTFYTYGTNMSDNQGGTYIKREGFHVFMNLNSIHSSPPIPLLHVIATLDTEFVQPIGAIETPGYNNDATIPFIPITIFGLNQGANARKMKAVKVTPNANTAIGMYDWNMT